MAFNVPYDNAPLHRARRTIVTVALQRRRTQLSGRAVVVAARW